MRIESIVFAGTATDRRAEMTAFVSQVLGLAPLEVPDVEADLFGLPDGSQFAVASPDGMGPTTRTLGFLVSDLDQALSELRATGVRADAEITENSMWRYVHFTAPDGQLYELVERRSI